MTQADRVKYLRVVLVLVGLVFIFGIWPLGLIWPSGWSWHTEGRSEYYEMILGIYATLGVFLLIASRNPLAHASLIWFTIWSSFCSWRDHGGAVAFQGAAHGPSMGRCAGADCRRCGAGGADAAAGVGGRLRDLNSALPAGDQPCELLLFLGFHAVAVLGVGKLA